MKMQDFLNAMEVVIEKFKNKEYYKEQIEEMRENCRRLKLLPPTELRKELFKSKEKSVKKLLKKLDISITELLPDVNFVSY